MGVYLYPGGVEAELKNAYIGEVTGWNPGSDTIFYVIGDGSITDSGPNHISFTSQNLTFPTEGSLTYINFAGSNANGFYTTAYNIPCPYTYNMWIYAIGGIYGPRLLDNTDSNDSAMQISYNNRSTIYIASSDTGYVLPKNAWKNLCITLDSSGNCAVYINGTSVYTGSGRRTNAATGIIVGYKKSNSSDYFQGRMSKIILENKIWTAEEIANYYNASKEFYGIS